MRHCKWSLILMVALLRLGAAERINQEGRVLGSAPVVSTPLLFNTQEADVVLSALQIMPPDSPWNEDISARPALGNSEAMISQIVADLRADRRTLRAFHEMNFVLVPDNQPLVPVEFFNYADESDPSPYPFPGNLPVETWPSETGSLSLSDWQRDVNSEGGDRHAIAVMPGAGFIWETWLTRFVDGHWEASNGAKFDLKSNTLRPKGWTSGDAAGLPMFPALVRFDECERGMVEHAMRLVVKRTRLGPIYPATHQASVGGLTNPNIPAMGQRLRLKAGFAIPTGWTGQERAVLFGLKKYGAIVADNGNFFSISVTPDDRYPANAFSHLSSISITNFEVVQTTGPTEGPRSPGAPQVQAGEDFRGMTKARIQLNGSVKAMLPTEVKWSVYSGPAAPIFEDATRPTTGVTFGASGDYLLLLGANDGVHAPVYDAVRVTVTTGRNIRASGTIGGGDYVRLDFSGEPPFIVEESNDVTAAAWRVTGTFASSSALLPTRPGLTLFRLHSN